MLWLLCAAYVLLGFVGRAPWKSTDIAQFGFMRALAFDPSANWLQPRMLDVMADASHGLLPIWLGALALKLAPAGLDQALVSRIPFMLTLALALWATWAAAYKLARNLGAQPIAFAFGGEADPRDYARVIADGALLALLATLGLAQFSHETAPPVVQLAASSALLYGLAVTPYRPLFGALPIALGLFTLSLSGAPWLSLIYGLGGATLLALAHTRLNKDADPQANGHARWQPLVLMLLATLASTALAWALGLMPWPPQGNPTHWTNLLRLFAWFLWPAWPFVLWTLWRWRRQLRQPAEHRQLALPLLFMLPALIATWSHESADRALLLALPSLAILAAFALPTFDRSVSALIDWFSLLFFSTLGLVIWVVWLSLMTGVPAKPAANVARLAPGFEPSFSWLATALAVLATLAWGWLVRWRTKRSRAAIWKSLALPAGGAVLCWALLMTLWLPALDYARSYTAQIDRLHRVVQDANCVALYGMSAPQAAAVLYHAQTHGGKHPPAKSFTPDTACTHAVINIDALPQWAALPAAAEWAPMQAIRRPTDRDARDDDMLVMRRTSALNPSPP